MNNTSIKEQLQEAKQEIYTVIQKHIGNLNKQGFNVDIHLSVDSANYIGKSNPEQVIDVRILASVE